MTIIKLPIMILIIKMIPLLIMKFVETIVDIVNHWLVLYQQNINI